MTQITFDEFKARAIAYAAEEYCLDENGIDDEWHAGSYHMGISAEHSVDAFAEKYALSRRSEFTLDQAFDAIMSVMQGTSFGLEDMLVGQGYSK